LWVWRVERGRRHGLVHRHLQRLGSDGILWLRLSSLLLLELLLLVLLAGEGLQVIVKVGRGGRAHVVLEHGRVGRCVNLERLLGLLRLLVEVRLHGGWRLRLRLRG
jgi:hypothetical protein